MVKIKRNSDDPVDDERNLWTVAVFAMEDDAQEQLVSMGWWWRAGVVHRLLQQSNEAVRNQEVGTVYNQWRVLESV